MVEVLPDLDQPQVNSCPKIKARIALSRPFDLARHDAAAARGVCPRHTMSLLRDALDADIIVPMLGEKTLGDRALAIVPGIGTPELWGLARRVAHSTSPGDVVFSIGEDTGFPIALHFARLKARPKLVVFVHHPERPRVRALFKLTQVKKHVDLFITNTEYKATFLREAFGIEAERVVCIDEQTDTEFFTPGPKADAARPLIGSGGLEQRDYVTLAAATTGMGWDVRVSAVSPNAAAKADTFPSPLPDHMVVAHHEWQELRDLYRNSDVFVISLKEHTYQAGLTTLFEALACRRPVVMTRVPGLVEDFADNGFITAVPPGDATAMRDAIRGLLDDPERAARQAALGYDAVRAQYRAERYVETLAEKISTTASL
ncbi:MAG: glycosyltransferase family 4 protein [Pseudomonadota bacterium]